MSDSRLPERSPTRLITSSERWGWEYRDPRTARDVFDEDPPALVVADSGWATELAVRTDQAQRGRRAQSRIAGGLAVVTAAFVPFEPTLALLPGAVCAALGYRAWIWPPWVRRQADRAYRRWLTRCVDRHSTTQHLIGVWSLRRAHHEHANAEQARAIPQWVPVRPATVERADVCGGNAFGWQCLLAATAGSLLGSGTQVTVIDLSQDRVTGPLVRLAAQGGYGTTVLSLPEQLSGVNLLAGLSPEEVGVVVTEAVHAAEKEGGTDSRAIDATLIQQVCELLEQPITFTRLHAALRALLRQVEPPTDGDGSPLTVGEYAALVDLMGESARRSAEPRLFLLAAAVQRLAALGGDDGDPAILNGQREHLRVIQVTEDVPDLTADLLSQVLAQVLLRALRREPRIQESERVLVVAGADCLPRAHVERLDLLARRRGIRLVLMFRHLRDDAVDLLGGGEAAVFMRLGNAKEAEQAATFIGREHRFVASQFTYTRGENTSVSSSEALSRGSSFQESSSVGEQSSRSRGLDIGLLFAAPNRSGNTSTGQQSSQTSGRGSSFSTSETRSAQSGTSTSETFGYQRTYDYTVTPKVLQELSPTAFMLVDPRDPGSPRLGDCDPAILDEPRVADPPLAMAQLTPPDHATRQLPTELRQHQEQFDQPSHLERPNDLVRLEQPNDLVRLEQPNDLVRLEQPNQSNQPNQPDRPRQPEQPHWPER